MIYIIHKNLIINNKNINSIFMIKKYYYQKENVQINKILSIINRILTIMNIINKITWIIPLLSIKISNKNNLSILVYCKIVNQGKVHQIKILITHYVVIGILIVLHFIIKISIILHY